MANQPGPSAQNAKPRAESRFFPALDTKEWMRASTPRKTGVVHLASLFWYRACSEPAGSLIGKAKSKEKHSLFSSNPSPSYASFPSKGEKRKKKFSIICRHLTNWNSAPISISACRQGNAFASQRSASWFLYSINISGGGENFTAFHEASRFTSSKQSRGLTWSLLSVGPLRPPPLLGEGHTCIPLETQDVL